MKINQNSLLKILIFTMMILAIAKYYLHDTKQLKTLSQDNLKIENRS